MTLAMIDFVDLWEWVRGAGSRVFVGFVGLVLDESSDGDMKDVNFQDISPPPIPRLIHLTHQSIPQSSPPRSQLPY